MVCFTFAARHLIVVCTQTCTFRCCIVLRQLYADCMRCCILVSVMLWYHVGNPGHMALSYVAVGSICASPSGSDGNVRIWNSTAYRALHLLLQSTHYWEHNCHAECNVHFPKYHIVFYMIVILLILKYLLLVSFKTSEVPLHLYFISLMGAREIPLYYV